MASQTAIEYGASRLRLLEFDGTGRKLRVQAVHEVSLEVGAAEDDDEAEELRAAAIVEAVKDSGVRLDPSAMAFDSAHAIFREFDLPFTNEDQIRKVVRFEAEGHLPVEIDDVIIQHLVLRKTRDKSRVLVAAVKKDDLLDRLDILEEANLDPMLVDLDDLALYHALVGVGLAEEGRNFAVINAQERDTSLLFIQNGKLFALRSIRIGTFSVTHGHATDEVGTDAAEHEIERARTHDYLTRLAREMRRTISTLPALEELETVYVTGSGCRLEGFGKAVGEVFDKETETLDWLDYVDHRLSDEEARHFGLDLGVLLGMAFKLSGMDVTHTEFRREEAAYTRKFDQVATPLVVLAFLVLLAAAFPAIDAFMRVRKLKSEYRSMTALAADQLKELADDPGQVDGMLERAEFGPARIQRALDEVRRYKQEVQGQLGRSDLIPELPSALTVWIELFNTLEENEREIGRFQIQRLDINVGLKQPVIKLSGELEDTSRYQSLEDILRGRPMFEDVISGSLKSTPEGTTQFTDLTIMVDPERIRPHGAGAE